MATWTYKAVVIRGVSGKSDRLANSGEGRPLIFEEHDWKGPDELARQLSANGLAAEMVKVTIETVTPPAAQ